jgi:Tfp pilus assembly PilM family ATPase
MPALPAQLAPVVDRLHAAVVPLRRCGGGVLPIGLDVGHRELRLVQLAIRGDRVGVTAAVCQTLKHSTTDDHGLLTDEAADALAKTLRTGRLRGRRIVTSVPHPMCRVKTLRRPDTDPDQLRQGVERDAASLFHDMTGQISVRCIASGEVHQRPRNGERPEPLREVLAAAAQIEPIERYLNQLHQIGATVAALDFEPCALYRGLERFFRRKEDEEGVHVIFDIGHHSGQVIIGRGRQVGFYKALDTGMAALQNAVAERLAIEQGEAAALLRRVDADADRPMSEGVRRAVTDATRATVEHMVHEVALCLRYWAVTFRGLRPARLSLSGRCDFEPLQTALGKGLNLTIETARPLGNLDAGGVRQLDADRGTWSAAVGMALRFAPGPYRGSVGPTRAEQADAQAADEAVHLEPTPVRLAA